MLPGAQHISNANIYIGLFFNGTDLNGHSSSEIVLFISTSTCFLWDMMIEVYITFMDMINTSTYLILVWRGSFLQYFYSDWNFHIFTLWHPHSSVHGTKCSWTQNTSFPQLKLLIYEKNEQALVGINIDKETGNISISLSYSYTSGWSGVAIYNHGIPLYMLIESFLTYFDKPEFAHVWDSISRGNRLLISIHTSEFECEFSRVLFRSGSLFT